uniref:Uncharacterized protein n=1 Tax=Utricularia reniformis TaxID=192314 RepID=A0A1Y0B1D6_9LAMI|nr:hypothetical protein AEK19_MT1007 [Utricularia reniformis]ART31230.1 hypothetical protein AEK19_MT1007 [Utricularia reniformis]
MKQEVDNFLIQLVQCPAQTWFMPIMQFRIVEPQWKVITIACLGHRLLRDQRTIGFWILVRQLNEK